MRVYELAKEVGLSSKELLAKLQDLGVEAKSHMSAIDGAAVELIRKEIGKAAPAPAPAPEEPPAKPEKPGEPPDKAETEEEAPKADQESAPAGPAAQEETVITVRGAVVVKDLAESIGIRPNRLIAELMKMNILASINERLEVPVAKKIAEAHGFTLNHEKKGSEHRPVFKKNLIETPEAEDRPEDLVHRPPVVTFLGHVDHGKTSLLDKIRDTAVTEGESGGITQHIGAYTVDVGGRQITFLDTPGHAAFTAMRARGANLTDIAVIVVAADDGIMPQTKEAIAHAQAAGVAMIVAINKMDLPAANADRTKQQLQADGMTPEDWGGDLICCEVSAQTGDGLDHLLEMILLQAEVLELKANPERRATGYVIEAQLEPGMGPTANLLISAGTLKVGDVLLCGRFSGRVRALINDHAVKVKSAAPATPVKCLGLSGVPDAGQEFRVCSNDKIARTSAEQEAAAQKSEQVAVPRKASLDALFDQLKEEEKLELKVILKADTQGSVEAIAQSLEGIQSDKVALNIMLGTTGNITENDVMLASASNAVVLGFHVAKETGVDAAAKHEGVEIRLHQVIYEMIDQVREAMTGLLAPKLEQRTMGHAEIKQVFPIGKGGKVAGCLVTDGSVTPKFTARVRREDEVLFEGAVESLKHFQDDSAEIREGQECGIRLQKFQDFAEGDILEFYQTEEVAQTL